MKHLLLISCLLLLASYGCKKKKKHSIRYEIDSNFDLGQITFLDESGMGLVKSPPRTWSRTIEFKISSTGGEVWVRAETENQPNILACKSIIASIYDNGILIASDEAVNNCDNKKVKIDLTATLE